LRRNRCLRQCKAFNTADGVREWHVNASRGTFLREYLKDVLLTLTDQQVLREIGFNLNTSRAANGGDSLKEDTYLASVMSDLARRMFAMEYNSMLLYRFRPPYCFAALVSSEAADVSQCLDELKTLWAKLLEAELAAIQDKWLANFLRSLLWPRSTFCREVLISLAECNFDHVPPDITERLTKAWIVESL